VPSSGNAWDNIRDSICAFLNTRGGVVILGVKDEQQPHRHYSFTGYTENNSGNLSALRTAFKDAKGNSMDVGDCLLVEVKVFATGQIAVVRVSALAKDRKFCFYREEARERVADRDEKIPRHHVDEQEERKREMETYRELRAVESVGLNDLSRQRVNELVLLINQGQSQPIETIKSTLQDAAPFLEKRRFMLKDGQITTLALTPSNNHFGAINELRNWGLIDLHPVSDRFKEVYVVCREVATEDGVPELRTLFGRDFDNLDGIGQQTLNMILLAEKFSSSGGLNAKQVSRLLKHRMSEEYQEREEDEFYRAIRYRIERMAPDKMLSIRGPSNRPMFQPNRSYQQAMF
jgi:hypothetical protein